MRAEHAKVRAHLRTLRTVQARDALMHLKESGWRCAKKSVEVMTANTLYYK
jgi:hypothetical protein